MLSGAHSYSTQRSDSIQAGTKRQVKVVCYLIFNPEDLQKDLKPLYLIYSVKFSVE